jgi:hypothetical protein
MMPRAAPLPPAAALGRGLRALIGALCLGAVAGCGGGATGPGGGGAGWGGGGSGTGASAPYGETFLPMWSALAPPPVTARQVAAFADGSGVFRVTAEGRAHVVLASDAAGFVPDAPGAPVDPATIVLLNETGDMSVHRGSFIDAQGRRHVATILRHAVGGQIAGCTGACAIVAIGHVVRDGDGAMTLQSLGALPRDVPRGVYVYDGAHLAGFAGGGFQDGTFRLEADFAAGRATIEATTQDLRLSGAGLRIDLATGEFAGEALSLEGLGDAPRGASLRGSFHGAGATGVSGIWTENAPAPQVFGAIAGSRP